MKRKNIILLISVSAVFAILIMLLSSMNNNVISNDQDLQLEVTSSYGVSRDLEGDTTGGG